MKKLLIAVAALISVAAIALAQTNPFENRGAGATVPAIHVRDVTPSDTCNDQFPENNRGLWIGSAGNVRVKTFGGETITIVGVQSGALLPVVVQCVFATSTTATSIQVWW